MVSRIIAALALRTEFNLSSVTTGSIIFALMRIEPLSYFTTWDTSTIVNSATAQSLTDSTKFSLRMVRFAIRPVARSCLRDHLPVVRPFNVLTTKKTAQKYSKYPPW